MKSKRGRSAGGAWLGGVIALSASACGTSSEQKAAGDTAGEDAEVNGSREAAPASERIVCPQCIDWAGGETSDFGDVSELLQGGSALFVAPTPCEQSEQVSGIDDEVARALGFGASIDRLATSFDLSFEWSASEPTQRVPATGYASVTRLRGSTRIVGLEHVTPTLAGCEDSLRVQVATTLEMDDGALSIGGQLATKVTRDSEVPVVSGLLDLSAARGTLEIHLPSSEDSLVGYVYAELHLWPDGVRGSVNVWVLDPADIGSDTAGYSYLPIEGQGPRDACPWWARPITFDEPLRWAGGVSLSDTYPEVRRRLQPVEPFAALWTSGGATSVRTELGQPFDICDAAGRIIYRVPFGVSSADGRVDIQRDARAMVWFDAGGSPIGWVSISRDNAIEDAEGFADATGISGVDFGGLGGAFWYAGLHLEGPEVEPRVRGDVTVEGVDIDGHVTGTELAITGVLESLRW